MNCLFGGNSCTWVLILVIVCLLCNSCDDDCASTASYTGCGCGCN